MQSAASAVDMFKRIKAAKDRSKGGEFGAFSLVEELAIEGLDIVARGIPPAVTEALDAIDRVLPIVETVPMREAAE